jgi:outer membrane protein assembly factor BamE
MNISLIKTGLIGLLCLNLTACNYFTPYRMTVQQGNIIEAEAVERVTVGLTRAQVRSILGTPLLADSFHVNRWDYVYTLTERFKDKEKMALTVYFANDTVTRVEKHTDIKSGEQAVTATPQPAEFNKAQPLQITPNAADALNAPQALTPAETPIDSNLINKPLAR